jgi:hypothetical protein
MDGADSRLLRYRPPEHRHPSEPAGIGAIAEAPWTL